MSTSPTPAVPYLTPAFEQRLESGHGAAARWFGPVAVPDLGCLLVSDGWTIYGYTMSGNPLWTVAGTDPLAGWTVTADSLYIQRAGLLIQYELDALLSHRQGGATPEPAGAFDLPRHKFWTSQDPNAGRFAGFAAQHPPTFTYSGPAITGDDDGGRWLWVLGADGSIFGMPANLKAARQNYSRIGDKPDTLELFAGLDGTTQLLFYLSGGMVVTLEIANKATERSKLAPPCSPADWLARMRAVAGPGPAAFPFADGQRIAGPLDAAGRPIPTLAAYVEDHTRVAAAVPHADTLTIVGGDLPGSVLDAPHVRHYHGAWLLYPITPAPFLDEYKLPPLDSGAAPQASGLFAGHLAYLNVWCRAGGLGALLPFDSLAHASLLAAALYLEGLGGPPPDPSAAAIQYLISAMRTAAATAPDTLGAMHAAFPTCAAAAFVAAMSAAGYSLTELVTAMRLVYSYSANDLATVAHAAGLPGVPLYWVMRDAGYAAAIAGALVSAYGFTGAEIMRGQQARGLDTTTAIHQLRETGFNLGQILLSLRQTYVPADPPGGAVTYPFTDEANRLAPVMVTAGCSAIDLGTASWQACMEAFAAASLVKAGYPQLSADDAYCPIKCGGYPRGNTLQGILQIYGVAINGSDCCPD